MTSTEPVSDLDPLERRRLLDAVADARADRRVAQQCLEATVCAAYEAGIGPTEISARVGMTNRTWVYRALRKAGWDTSGR